MQALLRLWPARRGVLSPPPPTTWRVLPAAAYARSSKSTYYDDLGLDSAATGREIREAYLRLSKKYHPDMNPEDPDAQAKFQRANDAHDVLGNPRLRRQYDRGRLGKASSAADREMSKHTFEGEEFLHKRSTLRDEYGSGGASASRKKLEYWMDESRTAMFENRQAAKARAAERTAEQGAGASSSGGSRDYHVKRTNRSPGGNGGGGGFFAFLLLLLCSAIFAVIRKK